MACNTNLSNFISSVVVPASATSIYTYNGYVLSFDGNVNNLSQFVVVPASPPGEFPSVGGTTADISFSPDGHTPGYYSFTFSITDATCGTESVNFVVPIVAGVDAGTDKKIVVNIESSAFNLYNAWADNTIGIPLADLAPPNAGSSGLQWLNQSIVNTYPGYSNNGAGNITNDTFNPSASEIGIYTFTYYESSSSIPGYVFSPSCTNCEDKATLTVQVNFACTDTSYCYTALTPPTSEIYGFILSDGTLVNNTSFPEYFDFPYDTTSSADALALDAAITDFYNNTGGAINVTVTKNFDDSFNIRVDGPCVGPEYYCLDAGCSSTVTSTVLVCF